MKQQPLSAKIGEIQFRKKLHLQHQGKKIFYPQHTTSQENLRLLKKRAADSLKIFQKLNKNSLLLSPFLELGAERCERGAVLASKLKAQGFCLDLAASSLQSANYYCPKLGLKKIPLRICADAYKLPFKSQSFNFIFTFQTLHHFPDPLPIIKEVYRVLKPGGLFYLTEEPVKQLINIALWRRDYHLRWWEKLLKAIIILPFISQIGQAETSEGALEETFSLSTWEKSLNVFDSVKASLKPYPFGPETQVTNNTKYWLKPKLFTSILINLLGGGITAWCRKKGKLTHKKDQLNSLLACPKCQRTLINQTGSLSCPQCNTIYPRKKNIYYLLSPGLRKKLAL